MHFLKTSDHEDVANDTFEAIQASKNDFSEERKELSKLKIQLANCTKAISTGLDYPELREEITNIKLRIAELEHRIASVPNSNITVTKEDIIKMLKKDAETTDPSEIPRLVRNYLTKIYTSDDEVIVTGGVHTMVAEVRNISCLRYRLYMKEGVSDWLKLFFAARIVLQLC